MNDEAKAVKAAAETMGKAIDAARETGGFIGELIKEPLRERVGIWTDNLRVRRWENQLALAERARRKIAELGSDAQWQTIPMRIGVPMLEAASLVEEPELQDKWVNLILNYGNGRSGIPVQKSFISILGELAPLEAVILDTIYSAAGPSGGGILTAELPAVAAREDTDRLKLLPHPSAPTPEVALALGNLLRLGCISSTTTWGGGELLGVVHETNLGRELVRACTLQTPAG